MGASIVAYTIHGRPERPETALRRSQFLPVLILITVGFGAAMVRGYGATVGVSDILKQLGGSPDPRVSAAAATASAEAGTGDPSEEPGT